MPNKFWLCNHTDLPFDHKGRAFEKRKRVDTVVAKIMASGFDGRGNYNLGVTEQIIFPEIDIDKVAKIAGMDITFVTSAETDKEAKSLLAHLGLPFKNN